ncbi:MAG: ATPase, P-type (transporting), HAD superfamily, subfamily IC [Gammaproteobacteria bacterium]|nr:ATPase, P-type (transporting), HAD superfamily, subfamily IC [Gammaproteobacteria bacterium]
MSDKNHIIDPQALNHDVLTDPARGLSGVEAERRFPSDGPNTLARAAPVSPLDIFAAQFGSIVIWILVGAALVSLALGETAEGVSIGESGWRWRIR